MSSPLPCPNKRQTKISLIDRPKYDTIVRYMRKYMLEALEEAKKAAEAATAPKAEAPKAEAPKAEETKEN